MSTNPYLDAIGAAADDAANPYLDAIDNRKGRLRSAGAAFMRGGGVGVGQSVSGAVRGAEAAINPANLDFGRFSQSDFAEAVAAEQPAQAVRFRTPQEREQSLQQDPVYQAGAQLAEGAREAFQPNPRFAGEFWTDTIPGSAGQMLPTVAAGAVNPYLAVLQYGLSAGQGQAEEAVAAGQPDKAQAAFVAAAPLGAVTEAALGPIARMAKLAKLARTDGAGRAVLEAAAREAGQEGLEQVGGNLIASDVAGYDPNRPWRQGVGTAMAAGAVLGGALGGGLGAVAQQTRDRVREQMGIESSPGDAQVMPDPSLDELPDYREADPAQAATDAAMARADAAGQQMRRTAEANPYLVEAGLAEYVPAEGFTPIDQAVRQSRLGRMDPQAAVAEAVPAEGWTPVTSFIRREQMRPRPVTPETAAPAAGPTPEQRQASQEFDRLLIEIGPEAGWVDNLDALAPQMETAKQDATTITARLARGAELRKLRFRAAQAFGLNAAKMNLDVRERAQLLPALQAYVEKVIVPQRQADSLTAAIQPDAGKQPVNTGDLSVGDVLNIDGEPVRVDGVDPDTGEVTLQDGTRFGRTTIADGQTIYVENVEQVQASTDFAPVEPANTQSAPDNANTVAQQEGTKETKAEDFRKVAREWSKTLPDADKDSQRGNNITSSPWDQPFVDGKLTADRYGEDPYVYEDRWIDPRTLLYNSEGMTYEQIVNMPTTQKYIEWYKQGHFGPPISVVFNAPEGRLKSSNRRRVVAAMEAGIERIPARVEIGKASEVMASRPSGNGPEGVQSPRSPLPASGVLDAPESVAEQRARLAREAAQAKAKADREKLAERQAKPLTGSVGDIGATDMFDPAKNDLFSAPAPKAKEQKATEGTKQVVNRKAAPTGLTAWEKSQVEMLTRASDSLDQSNKPRFVLGELRTLVEIRKGYAQRSRETAAHYAKPDFAKAYGEAAAAQVSTQQAALAEQYDAEAKRYETLFLKLAASDYAAGTLSQSATDKAIAALESLKVDTAGKVFDAIQGIPVAVWNGALSAAQLALKAGAKVADAIGAALAHIRAKHKAKFDEAAVRAELERDLLGEARFETGTALPDFQPYATAQRIFTKPFGAETLPWVGRLFGPRGKRFLSAVDRALVTWAAERYGVGKAVASSIGTELKGRLDGVFRPNDQGDLNVTPRTPGQSLKVSDVLEALQRDPDSYVLTPAQRTAWERVLQPLLKRRAALVQRYGLATTEDADGNLLAYFPRIVTKMPQTPDDTTGGSGQRVGGKQGFQKARAFRTEAQGWAAGYEYETSIERRLVTAIERLYKAMADQRLAANPELQGRTRSEVVADLMEYHAEELGGGLMTEAEIQRQADSIMQRGGVNQPAFAGRTFARPRADGGPGLDVSLKQELERAFPDSNSPVRDLIMKGNNFVKGIRLGFDFGAPFVQGLALFFRNPVMWGQSTWQSLRALFSPEAFPRYLLRESNRQAARELAQLGSPVGSLPEMLAGLNRGELMDRMAELARPIPVVGQVAQAINATKTAFGRQFQTFMDVAKLELWKAHRELYPQSQWPELVQALEATLLSGRMESAGVSRLQSNIERVALLAPSYYRGAVNLVSAAMRPGVSGHVARRALLHYAAGGLVLYVGVGLALGMGEDEVKRRLNPNDSGFGFWRVTLPGGKTVNFGPGGIFRSWIRLIANMVKTSLETPGDWLALDYQRNPLSRWLRGHMAPVPAFALDAFSGRDFMGRQTDLTDIGEQVIPLWMVSMIPKTGKVPPGKLELAASWTGLSGFAQTPMQYIRARATEFNRRKLGPQPRFMPEESQYARLEWALRMNNLDAARKEYEALVIKLPPAPGKTPQRMVLEHFRQQAADGTFAKYRAHEAEFRRSLLPHEQEIYRLAREEQRALYPRLKTALRATQ